ncbi:hepatic sodium/bile acid cotransporter-like [Anastrepha obliqua]|uniref:hepatic sodium/bile acid cotransporter-like n=1 Tax=Anastrepha obliqua TaxID=95512 RepID=UPI00240917B3|nr:hepatic sodium/bile acid cotransporter-like [Anastrepha obliqua]
MQYFLLCAIFGATFIAMAVSGEVDNDRLKAPVWSVQFEYEQLNMTMTHSQKVSFIITGIEPSWNRDFELHVWHDNEAVAYVDRVETVFSSGDGETGMVKGNFTIKAVLLGYTQVYVELQRTGYEAERSQQSMKVIVTRSMTLLDMIFNISVGCFVMVIYVNFGAVLDLEALKRIVLCPVGPVIGLFCQFMVMPILSFLIGYYLFREMIELRLGLFFLGVSPAGGSSNIFAVLLNGNLNLSITMTAISNLAAFGMMPLWIFTLGALIFRDGNFAIPYKSIASISCTLVVPIAVGIMLQQYAPEVTKRISKLLKPISLLLILSITFFGCILNSYMFKLLSLEVLIGSCILPWLGYIIGWLIATGLRQPPKDAITIAIETGIQNIGIAIFMLNFTLPQPQADMTTAVPIANSLATPLPLLLIYFIKLCFCRKGEKAVEEESPNKETELVAIMEKGQEQETKKFPQ